MKKVFALLLALMLIAVPLLSSCGGGGNESSTAVSGNGTSDVSETSESENVFPLEEKTFDGATVTIMTRPLRYSQQFCPNEEYEGSAINRAVEARNQLIEEKYGITIEVYESSNPSTEIGEAVKSDIDEYDVVCHSVYNMIQVISENYFYSLNDLLELDQPWWDQNANNMLTLSDKIFYVAGDAIFGDDLMTAGVFYNKDVFADRYASVYGSLYDMVENGTWTYDVMFEIAKDFAEPDSSGNWMTSDCYYGIVTDGYTGATMLTNGSGAVSAYKDEQNNIVLSGGSEASIKAFDKVYNVLNDTTISLYAEQFNPVDFAAPANMFVSGHAMFQVGYINTLLGIMENEAEDKVNPGVLPLPKYDAMQDKYYCGINVYQSDVLAIPVSNTDNLEATCYALELLGYYSSSDSPLGDQSVVNAFYETTLKLQSVTDDNDSKMLDLITNNRIYDLGGAFNWGDSLIGLYSFNLYRGANTLASWWDANLSAIESAMNKTLEVYQNSIT